MHTENEMEVIVDNEFVNNVKIAFFIDYSDYLGGAGEHMLKQALICKRAGIKHIVIMPFFDGQVDNLPTVQRCRNYGLEYKFIKYKSAYEFEQVDIDYALEHCIELCEFLVENNINLVHYLQINIGIEMAAQSLKIPTVMSIYSIPERAFVVNYKNILSVNLHTDSEWCAKLWKKYFPVETYCIRGYCEQRYKARNQSDSDIIRMLAVGRILEYKNQLMILKIVKKLKEKGIKIHLTVCGMYLDKDGYYQKCKDYIMHNSLIQEVTFVGFVSDVTPFLNKADVFICVSKRESFPQSMVEAMAFGLPIISTPVAGVPEVIHDSYNGFVSESFTEKSILEAFSRYLDVLLSGEMKYIIENEKKSFEQECTYHVVKNKMLMMYKNIMDAPRVNREYIKKISKISILMNKYLINKKDELDEFNFVKSRKFFAYYFSKLLLKRYGNKKINIAIWGAAKGGKRALEFVNTYWENASIRYFIDEYKSGIFYGYEIYTKERLIKQQVDLVIIATASGKDFAVEWLEKKEFTYNDNYIWIL